MPASAPQRPSPAAAVSARGEEETPPAKSTPTAFAATEPLDRATLLGAPVRWPRPSALQRGLKPAGKRIAGGLTTLGIETVGDLLEHLPSDRREARTVGALVEGEQATVAVQVRSIAA